MLLACQIFQGFILIDTAALIGLGDGQFFPLVHGKTNAYHTWRFDPIAGLLFENFGLEFAALWMVALFVIGLTALLVQLENSFLTSLKFGLVVGVGLLLLVGLDVVIIGSVSWVPLLIWAFNFSIQNPNKISGLVSVASIVLMMSTAANQVASLIGIVMGIFAWERARYLPRNFRRMVTAILIIIPSISALFIPGPPFERYQPSSHFVPDYNTIQGRFGLLGPEIQFPVIDFHAVRFLINQPIFYLSLLFFIYAALKSYQETDPKIIGQPERQFSWQYPLVLLVVFIIGLFWFGSAMPNLAQLSPIAVINRMLPGLSLLALPVIIFVISLLVISVLIFQALPRKDRGYYTIGFVILLATQTFNAPLLWSTKEFKAAFSGKAKIVTHKDLKNSFQEMNPQQQRAVTSPSLYLVRQRGLDSWSSFIDDKKLLFQDLEELNAEVATFNNSKDISNLIDGDVTTRVRVGRTPQSGKDALLIKLAEPTSLVGIWLRNDTFTSDYPRALRISVATDCSLGALRDRSMFTELRTMLDHPKWEGAIRVSAAGVPFFGPITEVKVLFTPQQNVRCILAEHPKPEPRYDWSVTGVQLIRQEETGIP